MLSGDCDVCINNKMPSYSTTCMECGLSHKNYQPIANENRNFILDTFMLYNLKTETIEILKKHNKILSDIKWIGCKSFKIPINKFWELADRIYDSGYGREEVAEDLLIVGENWWLERHEYDGAEWWEYKELPKEPETIISIPTLFPKEDTDYKYMYLEDFNKNDN